MTTIFKTAFAETGDKEVIAATDPGTGKVSLPSGWTPDYEKANTDPNYRPVGRQEMNGALFEISDALGDLQQFGFAEWQSLIGGWPLNARVVSGGLVYRSTGAANTATPPSAPWVLDAATSINAAPAKAIPVNSDKFGITDSAASFGIASMTWDRINASIGVIPTSRSNTKIGESALLSNTTGTFNTAMGINALYSNTTGSNNTASGGSALFNNTTGSNNTATGGSALNSNTTGSGNSASGNGALNSNTTGSNNTASGGDALNSNTTGRFNTAMGSSALLSNTTGESNTANGINSLRANISGGNNTASGNSSLFNNTTGSNNTASGGSALFNNTTGNNNTASGSSALYSNTTGTFNTASGSSALTSNTTGDGNTASGNGALLSNTTGNNNTASGGDALNSNTTGSNNTASGGGALYSTTTGSNNTATGGSALNSNTTGVFNTATGLNALFNNTTGRFNTAMGSSALNSNTTGSGNSAINPNNSSGTYAPVFNPTTENNRFCLGSTGVTNAYIQVAWTVVSDARDKTDFAPVPHGLEFVNNLKPTAYRYKMTREDTKGHGPVRYGFKAQDVMALEGDNPVIVDAEDLEKLRFNDQSMIAVLVNAIQELNAKFDAYVLDHP